MRAHPLESGQMAFPVAFRKSHGEAAEVSTATLSCGGSLLFDSRLLKKPCRQSTALTYNDIIMVSIYCIGFKSSTNMVFCTFAIVLHMMRLLMLNFLVMHIVYVYVRQNCASTRPSVVWTVRSGG